MFPDADCEPLSDKTSSTFINNMRLPVHRWFRYSAGFSAEWVSQLIRAKGATAVFDPFAGSATTLVAAEGEGVASWGIDPHPFVGRIARAKLGWRSNPDEFFAKVRDLRKIAKATKPTTTGYPPLIYKCYDDDETLSDLDCLRRAYEVVKDDSVASELAWLTLVAILRPTSQAGTAQWQ